MSEYQDYNQSQDPEHQHPYHPDEDLQEEDNEEENVQHQQFHQIFELEEFTSIDSQILTNIESELEAQIQGGFFASFLIYLLPPKANQKNAVKGNMNVFQTGTTARKNIQLQINQDNNLVVIYRVGKLKQQLFSQLKLKPKTPTHIFLQLEQSFDQEDSIHNSNSLTLHMNGIVQGQVALTKPIEIPNQNIFVGSEQMPVFKGEMQDFVFGSRPLTQEEIDLVTKEKQLPIDDQRSTMEVLEECKQAHHQATQPQRKETQSAAQRHAIPNSLSKTHVTFVPKQEIVKEEMKEEEYQKYIMEQSRNNLEALLLTNDSLNNKCRDLSYAFKWVFNTLYMLSPPVEDKGGQCLPFVCLNSMISNDLVNNVDPFPYSGIELDRFMKVIKYANLPLSKNDVIQLAQTSNWLRRYKFKNEDNIIEQFDGIIYDKFLITVRDSCMTQEEVRDIRKECGGDPHESAPKQGDDIEFDSYEELFKLCKRNDIPEEEARKFIFKALSIRAAPMKGGKSRICCSKDPRLLFYNKIYEMYPDFKTNPGSCEQAYMSISDGNEIVHLDAFTSFCIYTLKLWGEQNPEDIQQQQQQNNMENTHTRVDHNENLEECCKKLFNSFCFDTEPYFGYTEFVTIMKATVPIALYQHSETGKILEVTPYSSFPQVVVWSNQGYTVENNPDSQMLGEIMYKNDEEVNFLSAQARILKKQSVAWSTRDIQQKKKWNKQGRSNPRFGTWEFEKEDQDFQIEYQFAQKQKIQIELMKDEAVEGKVKFLVQELVGVNTLQTGQFSKPWNIGQVNGEINIQRQISGTDGTQFLDYIQNGLKVNLMAAVDWTASNREVQSPESLHYCDLEKKQWNEYQQALKILGDALIQFDDDKKIPFFGFGASPQVAAKFGGDFDCFPMNENPADPTVEGVQGMLDTYLSCREKIALSGPTFFSPILAAMQKLQVQKTQQNYSVAVLLTDGVISNEEDEERQEMEELQKVKNFVIDNSDKPISFIIIGIGAADLTEFNVFNNSRELKHSVSGKNPIRNNTLYVNFTQDCKDREDLSYKVLSKIKSQITSFYKMHNVTPNQLNILSDKSKTVLHVLHPEYFAEKEKKKEEEVVVTKGGKKIKKKKEEEKVDLQPQYIQINEDQEQLNEEENPAIIQLYIKVTQQQPQNGEYEQMFKNEKLPEIKQEEYNYNQSFFHPNKSLQGFRMQMTITNQVISDIPHDNFLTLNAVNIKQINPIWHTELENYEFPSENLEDKEILPKPCEQWNQGKFVVNIQRCADCRSHAQTSWHDETDFAEKQNEFTELFKSQFPNLEVIGNYEKPDILEGFDIYIRGVGPNKDKDEQGRIYIFKKEEKLRQFLINFTRRMLKPFDTIVLLCAAYADSGEMEKVQQQWFIDNQPFLPKKWKGCTEGACEIPERPREVEEQRRKDEAIATGTRMICNNWACGQEYEYNEDKMASMNQCQHHPGAYQMGSIHGYWPESWTCCRGAWGEEGCSRGFHKGQVQAKLTYLCLARGEVNPRTGRPDSTCGRQYPADDQGECHIHAGYYKENRNGDGFWTCCKNQGLQSEACQSGAHKKAKWPDEEAKKYFIEKSIITDFRNDQHETFQKSAQRACIYRETIPYQEFESKETRKARIKRENENEQRVCLRYGCKHTGTFKDTENNQRKEFKKFNCWYHPGVFDFGRKEAKDETGTWKPHWSCCIQPWASKGCKGNYHWGPLESEFKQNPPANGKWPDINALKNFKKEGSMLWKKKFQEQGIADEETAEYRWNMFTKGQEQCDLNRLPELTEYFKLSLMAMSEDLSYHFKYIDVQSGKSDAMLDTNGSGTINKKDFIKWWLTPLHEYPIEFNE